MATSKSYSDMTLEELLSVQQGIQEKKTALKEQERVLIPFLDAAWEADNQVQAALADPALAQSVDQTVVDTGVDPALLELLRETVRLYKEGNKNG